MLNVILKTVASWHAGCPLIKQTYTDDVDHFVLWKVSHKPTAGVVTCPFVVCVCGVCVGGWGGGTLRFLSIATSVHRTIPVILLSYYTIPLILLCLPAIRSLRFAVSTHCTIPVSYYVLSSTIPVILLCLFAVRFLSFYHVFSQFASCRVALYVHETIPIKLLCLCGHGMMSTRNTSDHPQNGIYPKYIIFSRSDVSPYYITCVTEWDPSKIHKLSTECLCTVQYL